MMSICLLLLPDGISLLPISPPLLTSSSCMMMMHDDDDASLLQPRDIVHGGGCLERKKSSLVMWIFPLPLLDVCPDFIRRDWGGGEEGLPHCSPPFFAGLQMAPAPLNNSWCCWPLPLVWGWGGDSSSPSLVTSAATCSQRRGRQKLLLGTP